MNSGKRTGIVWFRNDLRTYDQHALSTAASENDRLIPIFVFDPRWFRRDASGYPRMGAKRLSFLLETITDLREKLRDMGSDLILRYGLPEYVIPAEVSKYQASAVYYGKEVGPYERQEEERLKQLLPGTNLHGFEHGFLIPEAQLPFKLHSIPDVFTDFRKRVEAAVSVPSPSASPLSLPPLPAGIASRSLSSLALFVPDSNQLKTGGLIFSGGETAGRDRVQQYIWTDQSILHYYDTRNLLDGSESASRFSPWLSNGSLSPRYIYHEVKRFEREHTANQSTYWLVFELLWREFFRYSMLKYGYRYFRPGGINNQRPSLQTSLQLSSFSSWVTGSTGNEFVDALMNELAATGFLSNRGRQIAASYLIYDMGMSWLSGAAYFEHILMDYDVSSNYGNWAYIAGTGCDPRNGRHFDIAKQARLYDADGSYRSKWLYPKTK
jgi:cryptochrome, DASH family